MKPFAIIQSAYFEAAITILEMDVAPKTGNPKHYHTLFEETFEVLEGELFIGKGKMNTTLKPGDSITVPIGSVHFFKNKTDLNCRVRISINPGNTDFEDAFSIYYGLKKDGLISNAGVPRKLSHLAIFIRLNNSKMIGLGKIAEKLLNFIANRAVKKGSLETIRNQYTI
jgi:mannose-6-phosphate isomerase-like protein (cupin superfamily)